MITLLKLDQIQDASLKENMLQQIRSIFFLSTSVKEFSSLERKELFFKRWCGDYISLYPQEFFLMLEGDKLLGYLSGCLDSTEAIVKLDVPGFTLFSDLFGTYPAHLHINFHPDARGKGLGSKLIAAFCEELNELQISGVHLVTSPGAANVTFYQRAGFNYESQRLFNQSSLLFMGKRLTKEDGL